MREGRLSPKANGWQPVAAPRAYDMVLDQLRGASEPFC